MTKAHGVTDYAMFELEMMARDFDRNTTYEVKGEVMHKMLFAIVDLMKNIQELENKKDCR